MTKRALGFTLIALGASVWLFYAGAKLAGVYIEFTIVLIVHLCFVVPGAILAPGENIYGRVARWLRRAGRNSAEERE